MSTLSRLRQAFRHYSTILSPTSSTPLTSKQKSRSALRLLGTESNPERIIEICRAASLTLESHLDRRALSLAITKLSAANHFDGIRRFLDELKSRSDLRTERFLSHAIVLYGQANMLEHSLRTFDSDLAPSRSVKSLNALLFASLLAKNYKEVSRIYLEFPKIYLIKPNVDTYNIVIKGFAESGSSSSVYSILDEMDRNSVKPNSTTLNNCIGGFYREEKFEEVGKVMKLMEEKYRVFPGLSTYNVRIQSLCKLKRSSEAKALLEGMVCGGRKPNSVSYCYLIHGFCREGNLEEAKRLFREMKRRGYVPHSECYFTLVHFLCQGGDFDSALGVAGESMAKGWVPNFTTMKNLVNGLVGASKIDDARELIKQIKEKFTANSDKWDEIEGGLPQ
ncbi:pentatricopeptide repeat-containing protein At1g61870, mitochondrial [Abrus precatorius]|uniref:Pentatricopeptide repeat-containing protein At1g61870, mitochondrial n=1 Tax=Abrus precatorius TaxID=3816 RepID=A0A8B8JNX7_ABRPR|nr:pentatricopeptide repeat-containing protein At1g61870, mitochondrial [Abrus precatorius]